MLKYEAIFLDDKSVDLIKKLEINKLSRVNDEIHLTLKYKPNKDEIFNEVVGQEFELYLIGYGNDGNNSGFEIELSEPLKKYYINYDENDSSLLKTPHVTSSLADEAEAVNTKNLTFNPLPEKHKVTGKLGYWIEEEDGTEYLSFSKYEQ